MKKVFTLFLIFLFLSLSVWAEENSNSKNLAYSVETWGLVDENIKGVVEDVATPILIPGYKTQFGSLFTVVPPTFGTLQFDSLGVVYLPNSDYYQVYSSSPIDSFQYAIAVTNGNYDSAWVYIDSIIGVNDAPLAIRDSFDIGQDSGVIYAPVLENDIDRDRVGLQVSILLPANKGTVTFFESVYETSEGAHVFFPNAGTPYNDNLDLSFNMRDTTYMLDTVFVYQPDLGFYGYDSISYIIKEYRIPPLQPFPSVEDEYRYANDTDADTATVVFYVKAHDYLPVAVNDTLTLSVGEYMKESVHRNSVGFLPLENDLDSAFVEMPGSPVLPLEIPYILENRTDTLTATADDSTVVFYHSIAYYDIDSQRIMYREDSNVVNLNTVSGISFEYAPGYSGVDSLFYVVVEKPLDGNDYPIEYRGDTSELGLIYFVVEPVNDVSIPYPDTLDFDRSQLRSDMSFGNVQYFDVLSNDLDVDDTDSATLAKMKSLMGSDYKPEFETYGKPSFKTKIGLLETVVAAAPGDVRLINDSVFYQYRPLYGRELLIDSFQYLVYNGDVIDTSAWAFVRHRALEAKDDLEFVSSSTLLTSESDSTIASDFLLTDNDISYDTIVVLYNADGTLNTPVKSSYAEVKKPESGEVNYFYHQGFVLKDSFQYVVSDLITNDTAWVFISNAPCVAEDDTIVLNSDHEMLDVLTNDNDPEGIKDIVPFEGDTLDTGNGFVVIEESVEGARLVYTCQKNFFYKDSFAYVLTDVPAYYAANNFFTQDSAWVYVEDTSFVIDSDGDGIVNTMEDNKAGYQLNEDTLDFDADGLLNYLDADADGDGYPDGGDCDGDGILNVFDPEPGCGVDAKDDIVSVSNSSLLMSDGAIASNLLLTGNDLAQGALSILYNADGSLNSPSQSSYAEIRKPESGEANYIYHQGFTQKDSFQYIVTDLITNDTAWVFINNAPCEAEDDMVGLQQDPLASSSYYEVIDVLANDNDPEDIKDIVPFETDTLDTSKGRVVIQRSNAGIWLNYHYKRNFFYNDSFVYIMTDVPAIYAASDFFTQDGAWVYIEDTAYLIDSDGDGIVNTMEDNKIGYQLYEDTLDFDMDGIPNYLDNDANGFPAAGDCDGDGILNALDADPGCDDIIVSTAFTPNGDNVNDFFVIPEIILSDNSVMQASIKIYNRLGVLVYENNNYGQNGDWWDGKLGNVQGVAVGDELPNGVYLYYLIYNDGLSQKESYIHIQR